MPHPEDKTALAAQAPAPLAPMPQINPEALIASAIEKNLPVETMERLLAMREKLMQEQARNAFFADLAEFQRACPVIVKDKDVMNKDGRSVRYRYAPLDSIVRQIGGLLAEHGFSYQFETRTEKDSVSVTCFARHRLGHTEQTSFLSMIDPTAYMNLAQKYGSALTFGKRYAFLAAFGIMTGEDDDDSLSTSEQEKPSAREKMRAFRESKEREEIRGLPDTPLVEAGDPAEETPGVDLLTDFLNGVEAATEPDEITDMAHQTAEFGGAALKTAKRAVAAQARKLGFVWHGDTASYIRPTEGGAA